ncbi:hybrid sensor histidine kinase/response regulator [Pedobacter frigiditerrae]|uniref:histidine kinase n=1 Tax=Pedobacter frigiditerrae TaxID=2530452 RepID=A0A4R0MWB2_9SPHI|nr:hybrid sensor histidine kinase/response regulator [Pedobacter frigiditerrae]TCC90214.1 hybrid sensor histidine kinase/response regulator [Pedobacter frigiditerrae]
MNVDKNIKILIVDDNENNLLSIEVALEGGGYSFSRALSGREALRVLLHDQDFSLILLDVKMPIMDGYETAELIYERDSLKDIPIIFITAHDYEEAAMFKGYSAGAVDFIRKPFNPEMLRTKVAVFAEIFRKNQLLKKQEERLKASNEKLVMLNAELENRVMERTAELQDLNTELRALNLSKDRFLSVISHDLRNPLSSILISAEFMNKQAEKITEKQILSLSGIIHKTAKEILQQLNDLVDWALKQREKSKFTPCKLDLGNVIDQSFELLNSFANQKKINLINDVKADICVNGDEHMLRSILQNIITNAIKFTSIGGEPIRVTASVLGDEVEIRITDHGMGMSAEVIQAFQDLKDSKSELGTEKERGSGLGLLLVREFVAQHQGSIAIESKLGYGTTFKFTIPVFVEMDVADY